MQLLQNSLSSSKAAAEQPSLGRHRASLVGDPHFPSPSPSSRKPICKNLQIIKNRQALWAYQALTPPRLSTLLPTAIHSFLFPNNIEGSTALAQAGALSNGQVQSTAKDHRKERMRCSAQKPAAVPWRQSSRMQLRAWLSPSTCF